MRDRLFLVLFVALLVLGGSVLPSVMEWMSVRTVLSEIIRDSESARFSSRKGFEAFVAAEVGKELGRKRECDVLAAHFEGTNAWVHVDDIDEKYIPKSKAVWRRGDKYFLSVLAVRVEWSQTLFWKWERPTSATRVLLVDPALMASDYPNPKSSQFDFVNEPWTILEFQY